MNFSKVGCWRTTCSQSKLESSAGGCLETETLSEEAATQLSASPFKDGLCLDGDISFFDQQNDGAFADDRRLLAYSLFSLVWKRELRFILLHSCVPLIASCFPDTADSFDRFF